MDLCLLVVLLNLVVSAYAQSSDESPDNPPKKANGITITLIVVFCSSSVYHRRLDLIKMAVVLIGLLIFYYAMNIIRKTRKRKDAAALPQYVDLNPLQGVQNQGSYNPFQQNPVIIVTPPRLSTDHQHPQDDQIPPPYELPKQPPPAQLRSPS
ncbi:unnamed protein product [Rhizoctonia solani]|uniref:Uncharacterized protein n=1 Tax=Rhizoctonia solani TaxID=456999 RepID=A0A8H3HR49_9AGAM|nr:unnamed protein product [Rhizoctonia solani]CAE7185003.1 unnamed protein product [Rhizoctonia solani]